MEKFRLFKNTFFPSAKCNSWDVYWSCNKRFFAYYTLQYKGSYSDDAKSCYENITLNAYEEYIRKSSNIKLRIQQRINSFILSHLFLAGHIIRILILAAA